jgi:hypothetical protein
MSPDRVNMKLKLPAVTRYLLRKSDKSVAVRSAPKTPDGVAWKLRLKVNPGSLFDAANAQGAMRRRFYVRLRWALILGGIVAGFSAIAFTLPLAPAVADLVGRTAMLCLLMIAATEVLLPRLILTVWSETRRQPPLHVRFAARLSAFVPAVLVSARLSNRS